MPVFDPATKTELVAALAASLTKRQMSAFSLAGEALCRQWHFPESLAMAVGHHHHPLVLPAAERVLPTLVHVADILAVRAEVGFTRTVVHHEIAPEAFGVLGMVPEDLTAIEHSLVEELTQAMVLFSG